MNIYIFVRIYVYTYTLKDYRTGDQKLPVVIEQVSLQHVAAVCEARCCSMLQRVATVMSPLGVSYRKIIELTC